jgi:hypothetical protein
METYKDLWEIEVGDTLVLDKVSHKITDTSNVEKPDPFVIGKADDGHLYEIRGNVHMDTMFKIVN